MSRCLLVLACLAAACGASAGAPPAAGQLRVAATAYPLAWLAEAVMPDAAVTELSAGGQDPHDMELTAQQRALVGEADVLIYLGPIGFQPQVETAVAEATGEVVDAAAVAGPDRLLPLNDDGHGDEGHEDGEPVDPHLWFDPALMADLATATGDAAARAHPADAERYRENAKGVAAELTELAGRVDELLATCRHDEVVVSHEAYAYLTEPHGLEQTGISGAGGHSGASPADVARLAGLVRDEGLPAVLSEPVEGRTDAAAVAAEAGVDVIEILSLDVVEPERAAEGFPALLLGQATAVAHAAGCTS